MGLRDVLATRPRKMLAAGITGLLVTGAAGAAVLASSEVQGKLRFDDATASAVIDANAPSGLPGSGGLDCRNVRVNGNKIQFRAVAQRVNGEVVDGTCTVRI